MIFTGDRNGGETEPRFSASGAGDRRSRAMAIINRPSLIIADEPITALDVSTQIRILDLLKSL